MPINQEESRFVDFRTLVEEWNKYWLEDGTFLRVRSALMGLRKLSKEKHPSLLPEYAAAFTTLIFVEAPRELKGPSNPHPLSVEELYKRDLKEIEIKKRHEVWNYYLVEDKHLMKIRLGANVILRADGEYDIEGNTMYIVNSTTSIKPLKKKEAALELQKLGYQLHFLK